MVDCAVLMDEPHLLAHDVIKDQSSGFEAEWISWREIQKRHSGRELKQLFDKSSAWLGENDDAQHRLTDYVNTASSGVRPS